MRRCSAFLLFILVLTSTVSVFAGGKREVPTKNNVYVGMGPVVATLDYANFAIGAGYERAIGDLFSLGVHAGGVFGPAVEFDLLLKPRFYLSRSALENFFVGANLGLAFSVYEVFDSNPSSSNYGYSTETNTDFVAGVNVGYKFVFGSRSSGFSLEPSLGYDFLGERINGVVALGFAFGGSAAKPAQAPAPAPARVRDGIYIGIITFGPNAVDITGGPIYLDRDGLTRLNNLLDSRYEKDRTPGTALYYAAQLALANMKQAESRLPQLQSVTMFTFTDGIEISSTGRSLTEISDPGNRSGTIFRRSDANVYPNFLRGEVNAQIDGRTNNNRRRINGGVVEAYIAAVKGDDVTDITAFDTGLAVLSTADSPRYRSTGTSFAELERMFARIAGDIVSTSTVSTFNMITPEYGPGVKVRMTFGGETTADQAGNAPQYIEGTVTVINGEDWLTDVRYNGVTSSAGTRVKGTSKGRVVTYEFPNFTGFNINRTKAQLDPLLRQWLMSTNTWQRNTEYDFDPNTMRNVKRNNALVYLVLDSSTSINDNDIPLVRNAAKAFIRLLYEAYNQN